MKHYFNPDRSKLIIEIDDEERADIINNYKDLHSDSSLADFFEPLICNSELNWTSGNETGDLTDAPMLGILDEKGDFSERWAFMDYQIVSVLETLVNNKKVVFIS